MTFRSMAFTQYEVSMHRSTMCPPRNDMEAVTLGLFLGLTAPSHEQSVRACELADQCAQNLTGEQVEACKAEALSMAEAGFGGGIELCH